MKPQPNNLMNSENILRIFFILTSNFFLFSNASAELVSQDDRWESALNKDGVIIYTRDYEGSDVKAFKAETTLNAPINNVMSVMANPHSCTEWVHGCTISYGFDEADFNKRYAYSVNDLPWPVKDRDYVLEINTSSLPGSSQIMMEMHAVKGRKPVDDDYVRTTVAQTIYIFTPTEDNKTHMLWLQHTEPAGVLPSWLVNNLLVDIPFKSIKALDNVAQEEKYQHGVIEYDDEGVISGVRKVPPTRSEAANPPQEK